MGAKALVVRASAMLIKWGWDPLRTTEMIWLKMQGEKVWTGTGKRLRDQHEFDHHCGARDDPSGVADVGVGPVRADWRAQRETEGARWR